MTFSFYMHLYHFVGSICIWLITNDVRTFRIGSFVKGLFKSLAYFLLGYLPFLCRNSMCILDKNPFSDYV